MVLNYSRGIGNGRTGFKGEYFVCRLCMALGRGNTCGGRCLTYVHSQKDVFISTSFTASKELWSHWWGFFSGLEYLFTQVKQWLYGESMYWNSLLSRSKKPLTKETTESYKFFLWKKVIGIYLSKVLYSHFIIVHLNSNIQKGKCATSFF